MIPSQKKKVPRKRQVGRASRALPVFLLVIYMKVATYYGCTTGDLSTGDVSTRYGCTGDVKAAISFCTTQLQDTIVGEVLSYNCVLVLLLSLNRCYRTFYRNFQGSKMAKCRPPPQRSAMTREEPSTLRASVRICFRWQTIIWSQMSRDCRIFGRARPVIVPRRGRTLCT